MYKESVKKNNRRNKMTIISFSAPACRKKKYAIVRQSCLKVALVSESGYFPLMALTMVNEINPCEEASATQNDLWFLLKILW